jgi:hypothetical protein
MVKLPPRMEVPKLRNQFVPALLDLGIIGPYLDRLAGGWMTQFQAFRLRVRTNNGKLPSRALPLQFRKVGFGAWAGIATDGSERPLW